MGGKIGLGSYARCSHLILPSSCLWLQLCSTSVSFQSYNCWCICAAGKCPPEILSFKPHRALIKLVLTYKFRWDKLGLDHPFTMCIRGPYIYEDGSSWVAAGFVQAWSILLLNLACTLTSSNLVVNCPNECQGLVIAARCRTYQHFSKRED